ncbi:MAG: alpha/beta fold hydrolase [Candidatus Dormibacteraceae bacterium]
MPHLTVDGAELFYRVYGSGPAIIFAHGLGGTHMSWWQQVPALLDRFTCVTFSHRGFHPSSGAADPSHYAADLAALVGHLGLDDVRLVAQSMGGWTCMEYAIAHPTRVSAIVMAETTGTLATGLSSAPAQARIEQHFERGIHPAAGERMAREQPALHHLYRLIDELSASVDKPDLMSRLAALRTRAPSEFSALNIPVLWLFGEESYIGPEVSTWVETTFPDHRLARVPQSGHSIYFERPETFNRLIAEFLGHPQLVADA